METIEMPKTYKEQLNELEVGASILIDTTIKTARTIWSNAITGLHQSSNKQFTIRTDRRTREIRVWRLPDTNEITA